MKQVQEIINNKSNFFLIAGPCVVESEEGCFIIAEKVKAICDKLNIGYIFKASFKKANRTKLDSFSSIGIDKSLEIIKKVKQTFGLPTLTDIHEVHEANIVASVVDIIQIPAFLCRQTDLLIAAAKTGKFINIKKGQFLSAESMQYVVEKIIQSGNKNVILTDRGTMFGYNDLIVDVRSIPLMKKNNCPVIMDCTHSVQQPNQTHGVSGGNPEMIETIAKAAIAVGADGLFIETHPHPSLALSDASNMLELDKLEILLNKLVKIKQAIS